MVPQTAASRAPSGWSWLNNKTKGLFVRLNEINGSRVAPPSPIPKPFFPLWKSTFVANYSWLQKRRLGKAHITFKALNVRT